MQKKFTVLMVHNHYRISGGEDSVVDNERRLLEQNGHKVVLYTRNNDEIQEGGIGAKLVLGMTAIFSVKTYKEIKKIIKKENIDIVHVHNTLSLVSPSVYYAALACKIPVIQTVHNFRLICPGALLYRENKICEECMAKGLKQAVRYGCYRNSRVQTLVSVLSTYIHRVTAIYKKINYICLTEFNRGKLLEVNKSGKEIFSEGKIFVKPNFTPEVIADVCTNRENMFVYVGRLEKEKGIPLLLEAWKQIKNKNLVICGSGTEEEWCRKYVEDNHMDNVQFMGQTQKAKALEVVAKAQALIFPSQWYEGFGMTIIESFSCGTPVIVNDIGNGSSLVQDGINGRKFKRDSVEDLIRVVLEWKGGMYQESKNTYLQKFTPQKNYEILNEIYNLVIHETCNKKKSYYNGKKDGNSDEQSK